MNKEQILSSVRSTLIAAGAVAVALGWIAPAEAGEVANAGVAVVGGILAIGTALQSIWDKTHAKTVQKAADIVREDPTAAPPVVSALRAGGAGVTPTKEMMSKPPDQP